MRLTVVNASNLIQPADFHVVLAAVARQVKEDFTPEWNIPASVRGATAKIGKKQAPIEGNHDAIIYVGDSSQDPTTGVSGAYGYHFTNHRDIPYGFVYLDICEKNGDEWSSTLSHEVLELLADPSVILTVTGPHPKRKRGYAHFDLEICDPTQGDTYQVDSVHVSNFVTRKYFGMTGGSDSTNFMKLPLKPFGVRPGGYFQYEDAHGAHEIDGKKAAARIKIRRAARAMMLGHRRNTRRADRL